MLIILLRWTTISRTHQRKSYVDSFCFKLPHILVHNTIIRNTSEDPLMHFPVPSTHLTSNNSICLLLLRRKTTSSRQKDSPSFVSIKSSATFNSLSHIVFVISLTPSVPSSTTTATTLLLFWNVLQQFWFYYYTLWHPSSRLLTENIL